MIAPFGMALPPSYSLITVPFSLIAVANAAEVKGPPRGGTKFRIEFRRPESGFATGAAAAVAFRESLLEGGVWKKIEFKRADGKQGFG